MRDFLRRTEQRIDDLTEALRYVGDTNRALTLRLEQQQDQFTVDIARLNAQINEHIAALAGLAAALVKGP